MDAAERGWASRLASLVVAAIVIQAVTGLWLYLAPFSAAAQVQVILHVALGLAMIVPTAYYIARHIMVRYSQKATVVLVTGYALAAAIIVCLTSGVLLTWQAATGPKISGIWDLVHLTSGLLIAALVIVHLLLAYLGRRNAARRERSFRIAQTAFARRFVMWTAAAAFVVISAAVSLPLRRMESALPDDYTLPTYLEQFDEYRGSPFAPSYARTNSGMLLPPEVLANSQSCGTAGCHEQIAAEWQPSAHRFSAMNPPFQQIQKNFAADRSPADTRYCAGCHDPISLFAGAKDIHNLTLSAPGMQEGVSCAACHSIAQVDARGNGDYTIVAPQKYLWEGTDGWKKAVSDFLIRAYPRQHLADYDRNLLRTPEFCGACHKQFIPEALNRFGLVAGQNQFDEWRMSHWHADDPQKNLSCVDCHMRLVKDSADPGRGEAGAIRRTPDDNSHRHHGMIATNFLMPQVMKLPGWEKHEKLTEEWIRGETVIEEIAQLWPPGPVASIEIVAPKEARPGETIQVQTIIANRKAGHNLTTGPLDFMRAWVHLHVVDGEGTTIAEWGAIDAVTRQITDVPGHEHEIGNSRKEGTLVLEGQPIDGRGNPLLQHELWQMAGGKGKRVIFPGYSDNQSFSFQVPANAKGRLHLRADFNFRRYRQDFLDRTVPDMERDSGVYQPTVPQSSAETWITIIEPQPIHEAYKSQ
jgi:hypothetical protein